MDAALARGIPFCCGALHIQQPLREYNDHAFSKEIGKQFSLLVLQMLGLAALVCTLCAYKRVCDGFRLRSSLASLEQETNAQRTYVEQARMRYGQTRAFRHDIKNHLSVLDGLLRSGQAERARELPAEAGGSVHGPFISNPDRQSCDGCPAGG